MKKDVEMKSGILQQLIEAMMGETGSKVKPKMVSVELVHAKPMDDDEGLEEVLDRAGEREPMSKAQGDIDGDGDHDLHDHALEKEAEMYEAIEDEDEEEEKPRMSLQEFLSRK